MNAKQQLEKYLLTHPDFWEYENEIKEVSRLRALSESEDAQQSAHILGENSPVRVCA